jgi:hypothetical protein
MVNEHWNWLSSIWREEDCDGNSLANIDAKRLGYVQVTIESTDIHMEQDEVAVQVITQGLLSQARRQVLAIAAPVSGKLDHQVLSVEARLRRARPVVSANSFREAAIFAIFAMK